MNDDSDMGDTKTGLSQHSATSRQGESVVTADAGKPYVTLVPLGPDENWPAVIARRRAFFGSVPGSGGDDIDWCLPDFTDEELDSFGEKFV